MLRPAIFKLIICLSLILPLRLCAQVHQELGIMAGVSNYYGDLQQNWFPGYAYKPMGGLLYKYFMSPYIGLRTGANSAQPEFCHAPHRAACRARDQLPAH